MICYINKFFISKGIDSGKPMSKRLKDHIQKCNHCRSYFEMHRKLSDETKSNLLPRGKTPLEIKTISGLESISIESIKSVSSIRIKPLPIFASIALIAFILTGILVIGTSVKRNENKQQETLSGISALTKNHTINVGNIFATAEKPLYTEYESLNESYILLKNYFSSALDLRLKNE